MLDAQLADVLEDANWRVTGIYMHPRNGASLHQMLTVTRIGMRVEVLFLLLKFLDHGQQGSIARLLAFLGLEERILSRLTAF